MDGTSGSATILQPGKSAAGALPTWNDRDDYAVTLQAGFSYALTITGDGSSDIQLELVDTLGATTTSSNVYFDTFGLGFYDTPGVYTTAVTPPAPPGLYSGPITYVFEARVGGTVYAEVTGHYVGGLYVGQAIPAAHYSIVFSAPDDDGDTPATAGTLLVGGSVSGHFDLPGDVDEYAVQLEAGQTYEFDDTIHTQFAMVLIDPTSIYHAAYWNPNYPPLTYTPIRSGIYYLDLSTVIGDGTGPYSVSANLVVQPPLPPVQPTPAAQAAPVIPTAQPATAMISPDTIAIHRVFDASNGAQFLTANPQELDALLATMPQVVDEGIGFQSVASNTPSAAPVFRFFDTTNGSHLLTASASERDMILATQPSLRFEGTAFFEASTPQLGQSAVYRYFDTTNGAHLFTSSAAEIASIAATRPDLRPEGIAFYSPA